MKVALKNIILLHSVREFLKNEDYRNLLITSSFIIAAGTVFYHFVEGWSWLDSIYFCVITLTTIGYGDMAPETSLGKLFTIFYIILGLGMILGFINTVFEHYRERNQLPKTGDSVNK